jgi:adenylate kinase family enzyme
MEDPALSPSADDSDPSFKIQQNIEGDRNQVSGQIIDSAINNFSGDRQVINLTIYDRVAVGSFPQTYITLETITQTEHRQRQVLLNRVRDFWIKGVLEKSLYARISIELGLQKRLDFVKQPFREVDEVADIPGQPLQESVRVIDAFDQMKVGRTLLILGAPGSGKTITLLKLAEDLIVRTETDLRQPIPVVLNLSSWGKKNQPIEQSIKEWLQQELLEQYHVSEDQFQNLLNSEALVLLLDGLDEVKEDRRNACVKALNKFMQSHGTTEVVICCRIQDYQVLKDRLMLRSAVCIQPLTTKQISYYFDCVGDKLSSLKTVFEHDKVFQELATSPLMLSIMSLAYQDFSIEQLTLGGKTEDYRDRLFKTYIERMFQRRTATQRYSKKDTKKWLIWLAYKMNSTSQTVFFIERLQPSWLSLQVSYHIEVMFVSGMIFGLIFSHINGLFIGSIFGLWLGTISEIQTNENNFNLSWLLATLKSWLVFGAFPGLIIGILFGLKNGLLVSSFISLLMSIGFVVIFIVPMNESEFRLGEKSNYGIRISARNALMIGLSMFVISGLTIGLFKGAFIGLNFGLFCGLISGLINGGIACIHHSILRFTLYRQGCIPWNYSHFLDYASERLFLQKVGGGYIFVHRMLLEYFAEMSIEQGDC